MVIAGFDGRNISVMCDGVELKIVNELLKRTTGSQAGAASDELAKSGFIITGDEVKAAATMVNVVLGRLLGEISLVSTPDEIAHCATCTEAHSTEGHGGIEEEPTARKAKPSTKVN